MNAIIQKQLDRIDTALNALVSSIESYNPSVPAAVDLLAADGDLQEVIQHQANHARILRLRSAIEAQNQQITSTLTLLANTRQDLLSTPATVFPEESRNVSYTQLLEYAQKISPYTVPPASRRPGPPTANIAIQTNEATPLTNGVGDAVGEAREANAAGNSVAPPTEEGKGVGVSSLDQVEKQWLNPLDHSPFVPWPTEEVIKRGALGQIQVMVEQGKDPQSINSAQNGDAGNENPHGSEDVKMDEAVANAAMDLGHSRNAGGERRVEGRAREEKPKVFRGLDLDDDSDDD
ncbi:MAG: hypothetical protein Q9174_007259 [Haloplaca sp. 1 TL-2023]